MGKYVFCKIMWRWGTNVPVKIGVGNDVKVGRLHYIFMRQGDKAFAVYKEADWKRKGVPTRLDVGGLHWRGQRVRKGKRKGKK